MRYVFLATLTSLAGLACAQDFAFVGRKADFAGATKLEVLKGTNPGVPLVFDTSVAGKVILRPAARDEVTTVARSTYRFERQEDSSLLFFEIVAPNVIQRLDERNDADSASREGSKYENEVFTRFFDDGKLLQSCVPQSTLVGKTLTFYITIDSSGKQTDVLVLPEGSVAQCVMKASLGREYIAPPKEFVAKASIAIAP
jgi:hypothetical protein